MKKSAINDFMYSCFVYLVIACLLGYIDYQAYKTDSRFIAVFFLTVTMILFLSFAIIDGVKYCFLLKGNKKIKYMIEVDETKRVEELKAIRNSRAKKIKKGMLYVTFGAPIILALFVVLGVIVDSLFLSIVMPALFVSFYFVFYFCYVIYSNGSALEEPDYLYKKGLIMVSDKVCYAYGKVYLYNMKGLEFSLLDGKIINKFFMFKMGAFRINDEKIFDSLYTLLIDKEDLPEVVVSTDVIEEPNNNEESVVSADVIEESNDNEKSVVSTEVVEEDKDEISN